MNQFEPYRYKGYPTGLKSPWTIPMPSEQERDRRWQAIRRSMRQNKFDCLIIGAARGYMPSDNYLYYISNYVPYFNHGTFIVFPREGEPQLGVSSVIGPQFQHCATETSWIKEIVAGRNPAQDIVGKIKRLLLEGGRIGFIGYTSGLIPASLCDDLRRNLPSARFEDATTEIWEAMDEVSRSSTEEPPLLKKGCEILDLSFQAVAECLRPGIKECELWGAAEQVILNNGSWTAHTMYAASGPRPTFMRAPASHQTLHNGDVVLFEISAVYGGVSPQISFALSLGQPDREIGEMFEFCKELYHFSLAELEKKRTFADIESTLVDRIHNAGYELETPQIHRYNMSIRMPMERTPQPGDYFTVHPNVCTKDYTVMAKIGDTVRIAQDGKVERLHGTPVELKII